MNDQTILQFLNERCEDALTEAKASYGRYVRSILSRILSSPEDREEAENDVWMKLWSTVPPAQPESLLSYLGMLARQTAIDRFRHLSREKRGNGIYAESLEELAEILPDGKSTEDPAELLGLKDALERFLMGESAESRILFLQRYWYLLSPAELAKEHGIKESAVNMRLMRIRKKLRKYLEKEGYVI